MLVIASHRVNKGERSGNLLVSKGQPFWAGLNLWTDNHKRMIPQIQAMCFLASGIVFLPAYKHLHAVLAYVLGALSVELLRYRLVRSSTSWAAVMTVRIAARYTGNSPGVI